MSLRKKGSMNPQKHCTILATKAITDEVGDVVEGQMVDMAQIPEEEEITEGAQRVGELEAGIKDKIHLAGMGNPPNVQSVVPQCIGQETVPMLMMQSMMEKILCLRPTLY